MSDLPDPFLHSDADDDDDENRAPADLSEAAQLLGEPLTNRVTGDTALGCLGLLCLITMLPLLGLSGLGLPFWAAALAPLLAFSLAAVGLALLMRMPLNSMRRSRDPRHPLTRSGAIPIVERPATLANRLSFVSGVALIIAILAGYVALGFDPNRIRGIVWGPIIMALAGAALVVDGALVSLRRMPAPALGWARTPIWGRPPRGGPLLALAGAVGLLSGVTLAAFYTGAAWGFYAIGGITLVFSISMIAYSFARRPPPPRMRTPDDPLGRHRRASLPYEPFSPDAPYDSHDAER